MSDLIDRNRLKERLFPGLLELSRGISKTAIALYKQGWNDAITSIIQNEPSAEPYTDQEILIMQELEQAQIQRAFELGREDAEPGWTPVTEQLPKDLKPVNITYINEDPAPYYEHIKGIPFTATAIYYRGGWYWWSCTCADVLAEYGHSYSNSMDEGIEVTAWQPLPEPYRGG